MKGFHRSNQLFSLCGLNCGLCTMHLGGSCPGCGGGEGNQSCAIARCSLSIAHSGVEYCSQCGEFPCVKYDRATEFDSFITHRNQIKDLAKLKEMGEDAYNAEQLERIGFLNTLLAEYNDGRRKSFFCVAVNLLDLQDIREVMQTLTENGEPGSLPLKEKAAYAVKLFQTAAEQRGIMLKLRKAEPHR